MVLFDQQILKIINFFVQLSHFLCNLIWRLSNDLINVDMRSDLFRFRSKVESLEGFLRILGKLTNATNNGCLRLTWKRILKDPSKFWVSEVYVVVVFPVELLPLA